KDKLIKLNNSTYKINYKQSNQLHCNVKAPIKHVTLSNDNQSDPHSILDDDDDIKEQVTVRDDHPFTPVDNLLNQCKDSKLFSKFDMIMGYFQVLINPEHAKYTAFITHIGKFEYTRMPQVLVNSPSTFSRLMVEIFGKIKSLLQYFDELLVHSKLNYMVHFIKIIRMLLYCRKYLLFISREKSEMLKTEVDSLGFHIQKDGISPRAAKVRAISELPEQRNAKEAEAALGLFGFFRRHIENYAEKTYHLSKESKGKNKKTLSDESLKEFNNLKKEFEGENIVSIPIEQDNNTPIDIDKVKASTDMPIHSDNNNLNNGSFHLYCDVSDKTLSGVLYQILSDKFKKFQHLLIGKKVKIYTDHQNLTYIINKSNDKPFTKRQDNYMKYIKEFD
ncbi:hypothetical protein ACTFIY_009654, partial [Dictyostelium cf. discoideum]